MKLNAGHDYIIGTLDQRFADADANVDTSASFSQQPRTVTDGSRLKIC